MQCDIGGIDSLFLGGYYNNPEDAYMRYPKSGSGSSNMYHRAVLEPSFSSSSIVIGKWYHIAYVYNNSSFMNTTPANTKWALFFDGEHKTIHNQWYNDLTTATRQLSTTNTFSFFDYFNGSNKGNLPAIHSITGFRVSNKVVYTGGSFTVPSPNLKTSQSASTNIAALTTSDVIV